MIPIYKWPYHIQNLQRKKIMDLLRIVIGLVTFYQILSGHAINAISLSKEEDAELQRELQAINKPAVKTITVRECVFYYILYIWTY
jgi:hypothetical protein